MVRTAWTCFALPIVIVALVACARDRAADAPTTELSLAPLPSSDAGPTIRPPQQSDYLSVPSAPPPIASVAPQTDELDGIDIAECRELVMWMKRCLGESTVRDVAANFRRSMGTQDPQMRAALADACRRMVDAYAQVGGCGP